MMEKFIALDDSECSDVFGGRNEDLAHFIEMAAQCVGSIAKMIYLLMNRGAQCVAMQAANGYYPKF